MKDYLTALTEAVRLARLEIGCYYDKDCRATAEYAIRRLDGLLNNRRVDEAMAVFSPSDDSAPVDSPSIVPAMPERKAAKHH